MLCFEKSLIVYGGQKIYIKENDKCYAEVEIIENKDKVNNFLNNIVLNEIFDLKEENDLEEVSDYEALTIFKEELKVFYDFFEDINGELVLIHYIENGSDIKGLAKTIIEYLKENYKTVLLHSAQEAESYWEENDFKRCFLDYFYYESERKICI